MAWIPYIKFWHNMQASIVYMYMHMYTLMQCVSRCLPMPGVSTQVPATRVLVLSSSEFVPLYTIHVFVVCYLGDIPILPGTV